MKWPWQSPPEQKSVPGVQVALSQLGRAQWGERHGAAFLRDGFLQNAIAYRCVRMIAEATASVPLVSDQTAVQTRLDTFISPLIDGLVTHLQISGNAYLEAVSLSDGEPPAEFHLLRPDRLRVITDRQGWPVGWRYRAGNRERVIAPGTDGFSPLLHVKLFHPGDDVSGLSPLAAARHALDLHNATADWAKALLDNAARPSGALVYGAESGQLSDDQFDRLKTELERAHSGAANAGRPLLLEGGLDWKPMSLTPAELDFREAHNGAAREIALAFGVPPQLLGIPGDNTYANYREANLAFWRQTVLPLSKRLARELTNWLSPWFGDAVIRCDLDEVPALAEERDALWRRLEAASFVSLEEKRRMVGLPEDGT